MAEDTRKQDIEAAGGGNERKEWKGIPRVDGYRPPMARPRVFMHEPDEDPDAAVEAKKNASVIEAAKLIKAEEFLHLGEKPCVREGLLPAIGGGMGVGALRFVFGGSVLMACNWASGSFAAIGMVAYHLCQRRREIEKNNVRQAVKVLNEKQTLQQAQQEAAKSGQSIPTPDRPAAADAAASTSGGGNKSGVPFWSSFKFW